MPVSVASLHVYPVKGCHGIDVAEAKLTPRGFRHDRELMLVDPDGGFVSQRGTPRLALLRVAYDGAVLSVTAPDGESLRHRVRRVPEGTAPVPVRVHRSDTAGHDQGDEAAAWFSGWLGRPCRLVRFPDDAVRRVNPDYASAVVGYADAFPLLVTSVESLADLNARMGQPLPMDRFRPNLVLTGLDGPWVEDTVHRLRVGKVELDLVRRCGRCTVTTVDQRTGVTGQEPLRTLATFRNVGQKLLFGVHAVPRTLGTVRVGDTAEVLERTAGSVPV